MAATTLLLPAILALGSATVFATMGALVARRASPHGSLASVAFPVFWHSGALISAIHAATGLCAYLGWDSFALVSALEQVSTPLYCLGAAALCFYVLYLLTGRSTLVYPVAIYYVAMFALLRYHAALAEPVGHEVTEWQVRYVYAQPLHTDAFLAAVALASAPFFAAIVGYATLAWRLEDLGLRWRIGWVAVGLVVMAGIEVSTVASGFSATPAGELLRRAGGLAGVLIVAIGHLRPALAGGTHPAGAVDRPQ